MKKIITLIFIVLVLVSCEKVVDLDYRSNQSRIIIEGNITNEDGPYLVKVTKSTSLGDAGDYPTVDNAVVTINDDAGNSEMLIPKGNGIYEAVAITGVVGRTYTLAVEAEGQVYTAKSTMPHAVPFDSIKVEKVRMAGNTEYNLIPVYTDPIAEVNHYRFVLSVNNKLINQHLVQNDKVRNGLVNTIQLEISDDVTFEQGDLITIKMQCVDDAVALFYSTLMLIADDGPGGGTTPNNPPNNFSNGALGIFSAHTVEIKSITIQ